MATIVLQMQQQMKSMEAELNTDRSKLDEADKARITAEEQHQAAKSKLD